MRFLLLNLRNVPDDEADEIRALFAQHAIECYETEPNRWGISAGGIWTRNESQLVQARQLLADYQQQRSLRVRAEYADARRDGTAPTLLQSWRRQPLRVLVILVAIAGVIVLSLWPFLLAA